MVLVTRILTALLILGPAVAGAQPLAEVAKAEEARRKTVSQPAKVYTNIDLRADFTTPQPAPPPPTAPATATSAAATSTESSAPPSAPTAAPQAAASQAAPALRDQSYWKGRITAARDALDRSRVFLDALQSRINALTTQVINRDDPYQQAALEKDRQKNLAEFERVKRDIENFTKEIAAIEEEARKAGVPPGWLR